MKLCMFRTEYHVVPHFHNAICYKQYSFSYSSQYSSEEELSCEGFWGWWDRCSFAPWISVLQPKDRSCCTLSSSMDSMILQSPFVCLTPSKFRCSSSSIHDKKQKCFLLLGIWHKEADCEGFIQMYAHTHLHVQHNFCLFFFNCSSTEAQRCCSTELSQASFVLHHSL